MSAAPEPAVAQEAALLRRFDEALAGEDVSLELCVVGGAVIQLAFRSHRATRRPRALFPSPHDVLEARRRAAERGKVALDRVEDAARQHVARYGQGGGSYEGRAVRAFDAPPDYVLAMKCAGLAFVDDPGAHDDIRYLLRFMGIRRPTDALAVIDQYLNERQRPADLEEQLTTILG